MLNKYRDIEKKSVSFLFKLILCKVCLIIKKTKKNVKMPVFKNFFRRLILR